MTGMKTSDCVPSGPDPPTASGFLLLVLVLGPHNLGGRDVFFNHFLYALPSSLKYFIQSFNPLRKGIMYFHASNGVIIYSLLNIGCVICRIFVASGNIISSVYVTTKRLWSQTAQMKCCLLHSLTL